MQWRSALLLSTLLLGCTHRFFDESVRQDNLLDVPDGDPKLRDLQLFLSKRIVMRREAHHKNAQVRSGRLLHRKKRYVEEIVIPAGTPGISVASDERSISVAFAGDVVLVFERHASQTGELADDYVLRSQTSDDGKTRIDLDGQSYRIDAFSADASLMYSEWTLRRMMKDRRVVRGRRVTANK